MELETVFAMDWYTETGEKLGAELELLTDTRPAAKCPCSCCRPGPGILTIPNLRLFTGLVQRAQEKLSLTSPYFVPDDSLLEAITTAAYRGVAVELFVPEQLAVAGVSDPTPGPDAQRNVRRTWRNRRTA